MLFGYPANSGCSLLEGVLLFRCCGTRFAGRFLLGVFRSCVKLLISLLNGVRRSVLHMCMLLFVPILMLVRMLGLGELELAGLEDLEALEESPTKQKKLQRIFSRWFGFAISSPCLEEVEGRWSSPWS